MIAQNSSNLRPADIVEPLDTYNTNLSQDTQNFNTNKFWTNESKGNFLPPKTLLPLDPYDTNMSDGIYNTVGANKMNLPRISEGDQSIDIEDNFDINIETC